MANFRTTLIQLSQDQLAVVCQSSGHVIGLTRWLQAPPLRAIGRFWLPGWTE